MWCFEVRRVSSVRGTQAAGSLYLLDSDCIRLSERLLRESFGYLFGCECCGSQLLSKLHPIIFCCLTAEKRIGSGLSKLVHMFLALNVFPALPLGFWGASRPDEICNVSSEPVPGWHAYENFQLEVPKRHTLPRCLYSLDWFPSMQISSYAPLSLHSIAFYSLSVEDGATHLF